MNARLVTLLGLLFLLQLSSAHSQVRMTREEALRTYFPREKVERKTAFLTEEEVTRIQTIARAKVESKVLTYYVARLDDEVTGVAFLESSVVRTMPATYMVVINPDSTIRAVEILAFYEPEDYAPPDRWLDQFTRASASDDLYLKRGIQNISGATLTAQALSDGARRILAAFGAVVAPKELK